MQVAQAVIKKGTNPASKSRFRRASNLDYLKVPEGFKGRWCDADQSNIQKKLAEGWEFVNKTTYPQAAHVKKQAQGKDVKDRADEGDNGAVTYRELVGMMLPIEDIHGTGQCVVERNKLIQEETEANLRARVRATKNRSEILGNDLAEQADVTSKLIIE